MEKSAQKKENIKNIIGAVCNFITSFLVTVIAICAVVFIGLHFTGIEFFTVESDSMYPKYPKDSLVFVQDVPAEEIQAGDVVTYVMNAHGTLVTHRVVSVDMQEETFITQGDANSSPDPNPVLWGNVVGKVVFGIPKVGAVFRAFTSEEARPYLIAAVVVLGVFSVTGDVMDKRRKKKAKAQQSADGQQPQEEQVTK